MEVTAVAAASRTINPFLGNPVAVIARKPRFLHWSSTLMSVFRNPSPLRCSAKPDVDSDSSIPRNPPSSHLPQTHLDSETRLETTSRTSPSTPTQFRAGLVFDLGAGDAWDSQEIGSPVVKRFLSDDEERWYLWYHGSSASGGDSIGLAISSNGVHWERGAGAVRSGGDVGAVFHCSRDWWAFDTRSVRPSDVLTMSSSKVRASTAVYWLYYTGFSSEKLQAPMDEVLFSLPGLAISQDGRHWARIEGEHHSGALLDVGGEGEWDSLFIASPRIVYHKVGDVRMYYHSFDAKSGCFGVGLARSRDGIRWIKMGRIVAGGGRGCFDEGGTMNAHVVSRKNGGFFMAYEGVGRDGGRSIGLAVSEDGLKDWRRCGEGAVLMASSEENGWDNGGVGCPCLVRMDGEDEWRLYYRGTGKDGRSGIGMAVSEGSGDLRFQRRRGFSV